MPSKGYARSFEEPEEFRRRNIILSDTISYLLSLNYFLKDLMLSITILARAAFATENVTLLPSGNQHSDTITAHYYCNILTSSSPLLGDHVYSSFEVTRRAQFEHGGRHVHGFAEEVGSAHPGGSS